MLMGTINTLLNFKGSYWVKIIEVVLNHQPFFNVGSKKLVLKIYEACCSVKIEFSF